MADSSSLSDSSTSSSDYSDIEELLECEAPESRGQTFTGIPGSLPELLGVTSCMAAIQAAVWCLGI